MDILTHERRVQAPAGFEQFLELTMKKAIRDLLGESSMQAIFFHLNLARPASDVNEFHTRLSEILNSPSSILEEMIVKDLYHDVGLVYSPKGAFDFRKSVNAAMQAYSREKRA